jgi:hypothetical protein
VLRPMLDGGFADLGKRIGRQLHNHAYSRLG